MKLFYFLACFLISCSVFAQYTPALYIERYGALADSLSAVYGVPACVILSVAMLETGYGSSRLARENNNHFGIRDGRRYRRYDSVGESYRDFCVLLSSSRRYAALFALCGSDYRGWAYGLQECGYATDTRYAGKLIWIIECFML